MASHEVVALITYGHVIMGPQSIPCHSEAVFNEQAIMLRLLSEMHLARDVRYYSCVEITDDVDVQGCVDITGGRCE